MRLTRPFVRDVYITGGAPASHQFAIRIAPLCLIGKEKSKSFFESKNKLFPPIIGCIGCVRAAGRLTRCAHTLESN